MRSMHMAIVLAALLVGIGAPGAVSARSPGGGAGQVGAPASPDRSNKGGELRGLERADAVAGDHGDRGRDNAASVQAKKKQKNKKM